MSRRERDTFNEINITPLTDIFLVLLIIMMVIAPLLDQQGLNLAVPNSVDIQDVKKESKHIVVTVSNDDKYFAGNSESEFSLEELPEVIKQISDKETLSDGMMILTEPESSHGAVVKLMDKARTAGVQNISISQI